MANGKGKLPPAPDSATLLEVFRRAVPSEYRDPIAEGGPGGTPDPSYAIFRGLASILETVAEKGQRTTAARFYLPSSIERDDPASSGRPAGVSAGTVTLARVGSTENALILNPGDMRLVFDGPATGAREYVNAAPLVWNPNDSRTQTVEFVSDALGFTGNLEFVANEDGSVDLDLITIKDQDTDRAGINGSILFGSQSIIQDSGKPDVFIPSDVGLYVRITGAANPANIGEVRKISGFSWPEVEIPAGSGLYPRRALLEDTVRRDLVEALQDDGGAFTDYAAAARTYTADAVPLLPAVPVAGDAFYFGYIKPISGVIFDLTTPGAGDWAVVWEYWNGATWEALGDVDDPTNGFLAPGGEGTYAVSWTLPLDWQAQASPGGSGLTLFFARARVSAFVSVTTAPASGRLLSLSYEPLDGIVFPTEALQDDGGAFTDYTAEAASTTPDDVPLLPAAPAVSDSFYFGLEGSRFSSVRLQITTPGAGDWAVVWEYYDDGGVWQPLTGLVDDSSAFRTGGAVVVSWNVPDDWAEFTSPLSASLRYFVRARVSSFTAITTQPLAAEIKVGALLEDGTLSWELLDFSALGLSLVDVEAFTGGRDNDLYMLGDDRGIYQQPGEADDVFRDRASRLADVVSPNAILRTINRILRPLGFAGAVCDVQDGGIGGGYAGLFCDLDADLAPDRVGAFDLYAPGDLYPLNNFFVLQSAEEAYGWFLVKLPILGAGDYGAAFDDGPLYFDSTAGVYYGPAFSGFLDGYPVAGEAAYAAIYSAIDAVKAGGVGFTLIQSEELTTP